MEFEDPEEHEEEIGLPAGYDSLGNSGRLKMGPSGGEPPQAAAGAGRKPRYRECMKNHAVGHGGHAVDGCCEFMPAGGEGTLDALRCAACNCHRNFHRKEAAEGDGSYGGGQYIHQQYYQQQPLFYRPLVPRGVAPPALALPSTSGGGGSRGEEQEEGTNVGKKRFRTKFTADQKEKMLGLAERMGWRIQKQDEAAVQQFCEESGVKRHVLKVWMHNNKHTLGKKP
ncbi:zinc-finger homeodomain protein 2-like [Malania oleifera]|uniref:zinc-finger homeodomain protein 2-like n=1 Tax=Malania oleifera TaxID=397392 RepID=UPI0025AEB9DC|nr:zinc-finger homeodomain protein 2-like [Malania oleifera]